MTWRMLDKKGRLCYIEKQARIEAEIRKAKEKEKAKGGAAKKK